MSTEARIRWIAVVAWLLSACGAARHPTGHHSPDDPDLMCVTDSSTDGIAAARSAAKKELVHQIRSEIETRSQRIAEETTGPDGGSIFRKHFITELTMRADFGHAEVMRDVGEPWTEDGATHVRVCISRQQAVEALAADAVAPDQRFAQAVETAQSATTTAELARAWMIARTAFVELEAIEAQRRAIASTSSDARSLRLEAPRGLRQRAAEARARFVVLVAPPVDGVDVSQLTRALGDVDLAVEIAADCSAARSRAPEKLFLEFELEETAEPRCGWGRVGDECVASASLRTRRCGGAQLVETHVEARGYAPTGGEARAMKKARMRLMVAVAETLRLDLAQHVPLP